MKDLHKFQSSILNKLLFNKSLKYTEMKPSREMENNQFQFHLNQLLKLGYVEKIKNNYKLTKSGKQYATRMDTDKVKIQLQAKISARVCCIRHKNNRKQFLVYTRLKHPFYKCQGFPAGKVKFGEMVIDAAQRELKEETNLNGKPKIVLITHYCTTSKNTKEVLDDRLMFLCIVENPNGELISSEEGKYEWVDEDKLENFLTKPFETRASFMKEIEIINSHDGNIKIIEESSDNSEDF